VLAATRGVGPDAAFQQLRKQARSSSRKLADLAQEVVQAAQTGLARRAAALDRAQDDVDAREWAADQRNHLPDARERAADARDRTARDSE
jgi:ANTAR domain